MEAKLFSPVEADRLLPKLRPLVAGLQEASRRLRDANAQVAVLLQEHKETGIDQPGNPDRDRYWQLVRSAREAEDRIQWLLDEVAFLGAEVKDLDEGLVDFRARRDGEVVYLCWKMGEERVAFWHDLQSGFAGRRPLEELERRPG